MLTLPRLAIALGLVLMSVPAAAQQTLAEVLDAGGKRLSAKEFETEIVQRVLIGPAPTGGELEFVYTNKGTIVGNGMHPLFTQNNNVAVGGEWKLDDAERACLTMKIATIWLSPRCQYWYKVADKYYVSDSDVDRSTKVLIRTIKR